jgi:hypothetical protein
MIRKAAVLPLLLALGAMQAQAQDTEIDPKEALQQLLNNALRVTISAQILPADAKPVWNAESTNLTLPGRSIKVRLEGDNVRIYLICTPYVQDDGDVLLLAQGQVWLSEPTDRESKYYSTFYSIPVALGKKVLFFPLGVSDNETKDKNYFNIELQIKIEPAAQKQ